MTVKEITEQLAAEYPAAQAMSWDNPGLQVGRMEREVRKAVVALDATDEVIDACISQKAELLVTHHPLLMSGIKQINDSDFQGRRLLALAENKIAHYAMHTNYDVTEMRELAAQALGLCDAQVLEVTGSLADGTPYGIGSVGILPEEVSAEQCCALVKQAFGLDTVRLFGRKETIVKRLAVSPGSGKSMIGAALAGGAEILVTGDIGHHDGLDAADRGLLIIDAGHYGVEHIFIRQTAAYLREHFPQLEVTELETGEPFAVF